VSGIYSSFKYYASKYQKSYQQTLPKQVYEPSLLTQNSFLLQGLGLMKHSFTSRHPFSASMNQPGLHTEHPVTYQNKHVAMDLIAMGLTSEEVHGFLP
jgi:hypothetical protein